MSNESVLPPAGSIETFDLLRGPVEPLGVHGFRFVRYHAGLTGALARAMHVPAETIYARLASGARASLAILSGDEIAGYGWVSHDVIRIYELGLAVPIPRGHAYIWDCATLQPYRNRGIFAGLLRFMVEDLRLQGDTQAWAGVAPGNAPSLRAFTRAGFRLAAETFLATGTFVVLPTAEATQEEADFLRALRPIPT